MLIALQVLGSSCFLIFSSDLGTLADLMRPELDPPQVVSKLSLEKDYNRLLGQASVCTLAASCLCPALTKPSQSVSEIIQKRQVSYKTFNQMSMLDNLSARYSLVKHATSTMSIILHLYSAVTQQSSSDAFSVTHFLQLLSLQWRSPDSERDQKLA